MPLIDCQGTTSQRNVRMEVYTRNSEVNVTFGDGNLPAVIMNTSCGGSVLAIADQYMGQVYVNMIKTAAGHQSAFSEPVPRVIDVRLSATGGTGYDYFGTGRVQIRATHEMVFGHYGVFVAAHEWGHVWHDRYLIPPHESKGLMRIYNNCPVPHPPGNKTTMPCAVAEAFADWYAVTVRGNDTGEWKTHLEDNFYHKMCQNGAPIPGTSRQFECQDDGSLVEGAVHAFLWDLTDDTPTESHDQVRFTPGQVKLLLQTCSVRLTNDDDIAYTGIDHLIYCMEGRSPYRVVIGGTLTNFFNTRPQTQWPKSATGSRFETSDRFRRVWLVNLYGKRVGNDPQFAVADEPPGDDPPPPDPEPCSDPSQVICS